MPKAITQQEFINRAVFKFGNKFDYSKVKYKTSTTLVTIICPKHGEFEIRPDVFIKSPDGCPKCGTERVHKNQSKTTEQFIEEAKQVHGDKYDYSKTVYKSTHNKVTIICPIHGEFEQEAKSHLHGHGCPICAQEYKNQCQALTNEEFIQRAKEIHGDYYDYSKVQYVNESTPVIIGCPVHGWFEQYPVNHMRGAKCPYCQVETNSEKRRSTTEEFIEKSREIHGDFYDYSKVEYVDSYTPVTIICPIHGEFEQAPAVHLSGHGCPRCSRKSNGEERINLLLTRFNIEFKTQYRIDNESDISTNRIFYTDFYLKEHNIVIEFNGRQHYAPSERFGGEEQFKKQQLRDEALRRTLKKNNIRLLEIPYTEYKNIKSILIKELGLNEAELQ